MPFEAYKAKVRIVRDEATVKKWIEDQSYKTEFVTLNVPEPIRLANAEEVEKHFREVHLANIIQSVDRWSLLGPAAQNLPALPLRQLVRRTWEEQRRFPLKVVGVLSQQLASHGLQFFKVNKTVTHVAVARPHFLDVVLTPVSDGIRRIVEFIDGRAGCTRRQLMEALAPAPPAPVVSPPPVEAQPPAESASAENAAPRAPVTDAPPPPTPEQTALTSDLHWLIHQGHVIEFANGRLETAKKPKPKPARPEKPSGQQQESVVDDVAISGEIDTTAEVAVAESAVEATPPPVSESDAASSGEGSAEPGAPVQAVPFDAPVGENVGTAQVNPDSAMSDAPQAEPIPESTADQRPKSENSGAEPKA
jgi:hypothetical protein